jgi:hypothetical protein
MPMSYIGVVAEIIAVVSIVGHFIQYYRHKSQEKILLGFLHGIKPIIQSAAQGAVVPAGTWAGLHKYRRSTTCSNGSGPQKSENKRAPLPKEWGERTHKSLSARQILSREAPRLKSQEPPASKQRNNAYVSFRRAYALKAIVPFLKFRPSTSHTGRGRYCCGTEFPVFRAHGKCQ